MAKQKAPLETPSDDDQPIVVCRNRRAAHEYEILDQLECGIQLVGSEVKSIRNGKVSIEEAFVRMKDGEVWLFQCDIAEYKQASYHNHEAKRVRKLLVRKRELAKFISRADEKGLTMVPLSLYFRRGFVKVLVALAKGKKLHDKRESIKQRDAEREMRQRTMKRVGP
jgi:SsrA-binding protein